MPWRGCCLLEEICLLSSVARIRKLNNCLAKGRDPWLPFHWINPERGVAFKALHSWPTCTLPHLPPAISPLLLIQLHRTAQCTPNTITSVLGALPKTSVCQTLHGGYLLALWGPCQSFLAPGSLPYNLKPGVNPSVCFWKLAYASDRALG